MIATGFSKQKKGFNTAKSQLASLRQKLQGKGPRCPTAGCDTRVVREDILIHIRTLEPLFLEGSNSHCWSTSLQLECRTTLKCLYRSSANQMPCQKKNEILSQNLPRHDRNARILQARHRKAPNPAIQKKSVEQITKITVASFS